MGPVVPSRAKRQADRSSPRRSTAASRAQRQVNRSSQVAPQPAESRPAQSFPEQSRGLPEGRPVIEGRGASLPRQARDPESEILSLSNGLLAVSLSNPSNGRGVRACVLIHFHRLLVAAKALSLSKGFCMIVSTINRYKR